ncbi:hypothetical protein COT64_00395 [Candidatus Shapirobacteria bacterium CG09_land_8_20_14_0_10_39_12]|uniref:Uncharacterized protein n=1 Tax=Candidatus Shapirobacteria bacterium CG09_land_8_20_14_0_10_39_12 TaxID=1974885 RepID=A0A2H0WQD6_9BACT|nr:MAG: hypothetical protein COT64_00395 [Candidatus Shapirobacteria bacterium CG09_land_8_20_14_0_10_39_12]
MFSFKFFTKNKESPTVFPADIGQKSSKELISAVGDGVGINLSFAIMELGVRAKTAKATNNELVNLFKKYITI